MNRKPTPIQWPLIVACCGFFVAVVAIAATQ